MTLRLRNWMMAALMALLSLYWAGASMDGVRFENPHSARHQSLARVDSGILHDNSAGMYETEPALGYGVGKAIKAANATKLIGEVPSAPKGGNWGVDPAFMACDEAGRVFVNGNYIKNPTAMGLADSVTPSGNIYVNGQLANGQYMNVVDTNGSIIIGTRNGQKMRHPTLIGGANPEVQAAGIVDIRGGKIYSVDNASGHFKPDSTSLQSAESAFGNLPSNSFSPDFQGYIQFDR